MFLVVDLENVGYLGKSFSVKLCYTVLEIKYKKELNQNVNLKMFRITVGFFWSNLTSNIENNVFFNRHPMCLFHQPMVVLMFRDPFFTF